MRRIRTIAALVLTLMMCGLHPAYADQTAARVYDAAARLLTETENVTLTGSATFSLDGEAFKFVETTYVQDGVNSKWVLNLSSPREDGSLRENGFTAIANNRWKYGMEVYRPGFYTVAEADPQSVILRPSAQLSQIVALGHALSAQLPALPEDVFSLSEGKHLSVRMEEEHLPASVSNLLSLGVWLAVHRTMNIAEDSIAAPPYPEEAGGMADYDTPTQAIIASTAAYELKQLAINAELDEAGRFTEANGTARIILHTFLEGDHELHISFAGKASDYGTSTAPAFDPKEYGVVPAEGTMLPPELDPMKEGRDASGSGQSPLSWYESRAVSILEEAGFDRSLMEQVDAQQDEDGVLVTLNNGDNSFFAYCMMDPEGGLQEFRHITNPWREEEIVREREDITDDMIEECCIRLDRYMETIQPGLSSRINGYLLDAIFRKNEETFVRLTDPSTQSLFIVRLQPAWRVDTLHFPKGNG